MSVIRPNLPPASIPVATAAQSALDAGRLAAQKAFFAAALGQVTAASAPAPAATPAPPTAAPSPAAAAGPGPADRIPRPGSLLDIRV